MASPDQDAVISEMPIAASSERILKGTHIERPVDALVKMTHSRLKALPEGPTYAEGWPGILVWLKTFAESR